MIWQIVSGNFAPWRASFCVSLEWRRHTNFAAPRDAVSEIVSDFDQRLGRRSA
jgi:hypothetical protein